MLGLGSTRSQYHGIFTEFFFFTLCLEVPLLFSIFLALRKTNASWSFMWQVVLVALLEKDVTCCQCYSCKRSGFTKGASCCTWYSYHHMSHDMPFTHYPEQSCWAGQHMGESETQGTPMLITSNPSLLYIELQSGTNSEIVSGSLTCIRHIYESETQNKVLSQST